ncbi:MAG: efflux transporter outer membrane subunit [Parachlamydiaceae bacterium]|nr:efflux transporter outer membrane subunit [Parachlamydiaceae bacterium]
MKTLSVRSLLLVAGLTGCSVGPRYAAPDIEVPCTWHSEVPEGMREEPSDNIIWWGKLQDPLLNELIDLAGNQNLDLLIAATRVLQARAEANGKKGDLFPHIDGSVTGGHVYYSKDALVNGLLGTACPIRRKHVKRNVNFFELGFDVEWEIDFFGKTAHDISALKAQEEAIQEELCGIWVTLSAEIAKTYIELRGFQQRLHSNQRSIQTQEYAVLLTKKLIERGILKDVDLIKTETEWINLKAQNPLIELNIHRAIHRLSILLGCAPGDLFECLQVASGLPQLPLEKPIGLPSDLLRRRPDIRKAERELAAATERIGSAIAGLFPRFSLNGFIGDISTNAGSLFKPASATWFAAPQLLIPIFNSRLLMQDVEYNKITTQQAIYNYQKKVLEALEESENAIASYRYQDERSKHLADANQRYNKAFEFSQELYRQGVTDYLAVLASAKTLYISEEALLQSKVDQLLNYVSLYKALGG